MAPIQAAEIIFAQKLASNEKPERSKALLKLRKYIRVRSGRAQGGFGEDELMKIWKGLFYCVWMQDMPLLQEELSTKISRLLHSFQTLDSQLLFFKAFLQTMKREWTGIDRLRMDKFFQLVRFMFREVFDMLKRRKWESSVLAEFLQLFSAQLLHGSASAPAGLVLHVLDLYTAELALVGSAQLTAEQNLTFIEPFCKSMAKTKDRVLLKAIGSNLFDTIVDQVPFAIEDLLREIREANGDELDAGDGGEAQQDTPLKTKPRSEDRTDDAQDSDSEEDEEMFSIPDDMNRKSDYACGPVLQFDYGAIADKLFEVASNASIPSFNRSKIYKFVKIFRDLSEGLFPQDKVEDVSTDEEDYSEVRRMKNRKKLKKKGLTEDNKLKNNKKKKKRKRSVKSVEADQQTPLESTDPDSTQCELPDGGELKSGEHEVEEQRETPKAPRKTPIKKKKKQMEPAVDEPEPSAHQELPALSPAGNMKKKKRPVPAEQIHPVKKKKRVRDEDAQVNGHASETSGKKLLSAEERQVKGQQVKPRQFLLRKKKAPAPLFCKAAGYMLSKKVLPKKVRFGLKNNKTMEFRKSDRSSRVGVASPARVPFDPSRTPKTSVLKSPTPSPAGPRRATAADFF